MIKGMILALQFLTRIPLGINIEFNEENLKRSLFFFPLVGMLIGGLSYCLYELFLRINIEIASFMAVCFLVIITGGLHLDGVADSCDGFFSNRDKDSILNIMKDSRIGAFGVIGLVIVLLGKYSVFLGLEDISPAIFIFSLGNSRLIQGYMATFKKSARPGGMGGMFRESNPKTYTVLGGIIYMILIIIIEIKYIIPLIINLLLGEMIALYSYKKIGGLTGDVYGLIAEIGEVVSFISFIGVMKWI